ncbi:MAG: gliding motility-associated C-terminal domain-containing protein [Bacteroidales bacterium]|nr:gliding motility-associated C-terminal domain-containing protein [Bacteroidales bacterium]
MIRNIIHGLIIILTISCSVSFAQNNSLNINNRQQKKWITTNPFQTDVFIENLGQFDNWAKTNEKIKYAINNSDNIYFTQKGLTFKLEKIGKMSEEKMKQKGSKGGEKEKKINIETYYVSMNWEGCNDDATIEVSEQSEGYYTFGEKGCEKIKAKGYKKLLYKNLYKGIDVEYVIPEKGGIKYSLIVQPGADINSVKMHYTGDIEKIYTDEKGNIKINTPAGEITDHAPKSFYKESRTSLVSSFELNENIVTFKLNDQQETENRKPETVVIDPWTKTPTSLTTNNDAFDIDFDDYGNVYIAGGTTSIPYKLAKYTASGNIIWTFTNPLDWSADYYGYSKFCILPHSGTIFMGEALNSSGPRVMKINSNGKLQITSQNNPPNNEIWLMFYNRCTGQLIAFGGGTQNDNNIYKISDTNLTSCIVSNFNDCFDEDNDIAAAKMDFNGDFYSLMSSVVCINNNHLLKSLISTNYTLPLAFDVNTNYDFYECYNMGITAFGDCSEGATVRANALALNSSYLYSYDGKTLIAWNKTNGALLNSIIASGSYAGGQYRTHEGIDVDECNNVYIGGTNQVHVFTFDTTLKTFIAKTPITTNIPNAVYDIKLDRMTNILYVCGNGFVTATEGLYCSIQQLNVTTAIDSCGGTAVVTVNSGIPPYIYQWSNGASTSSITVSPGKYYVTVTDNSCMHNKHIDTIKIISSINMNIIGDTNICIGHSTTLTVSGANSYIWNNSLGSDSTQIVAPTATTTYTVTGSKNGCSVMQSIVVKVEVPGGSATVDKNIGDTIYNFQFDWMGNYGNLYYWDFGDGYHSNLQNPTHKYSKVGKYTIKVIVYSPDSCEMIHYLYVEIIIPSKLEVFNVFTPNGDGINDVYKVKYEGEFVYFNMKIFNRWGVLLFETSDINKPWDGKQWTKKGFPDGTYYYIISAKGKDSKEYDFHGSVTLIR